MRLFVYISAFVLYACHYETGDQHALSIATAVNAEIPNKTGNRIFKIGHLLFEAKENSKFQFQKYGNPPTAKTKLDTLYAENNVVVLGDKHDIVSPGIFRNLVFNSQFENYKVEKIYKGQLAAPDFKTSTAAKQFTSIIKDGCKNTGVNFAGHYSIVEWGCGRFCEQMAIVDRKTGQIIYTEIPFDKQAGYSGSIYQTDSRMLVINAGSLSEAEGYDPGYRRWDPMRRKAMFEMIDGKLKEIESKCSCANDPFHRPGYHAVHCHK